MELCTQEPCHECGEPRILDRFQYVCKGCGLVSSMPLLSYQFVERDVFDVKFVGAPMICSLLFDDGKVEQIMYLYDDFKRLAGRERVASVEMTVCALLVFTTNESNLIEYCTHFDLDQNKVYKILQEIKATLPPCVSRLEQIHAHIRRLSKFFGLKLYIQDVPEDIVHVCSSEHIVAAAYVYNSANAEITLSAVAKKVGCSIPAVQVAQKNLRTLTQN